LISLLALTLLDLDLPDRSLAVLESVEEHDDPDIRRSICSIRARALLRIGEVERARAEFRRGLGLAEAETTQSADAPVS
jgi:predicted RNA polymerase sigma factor